MTNTYNDDIWLSIPDVARQPDQHLAELAKSAARDCSVLDCCCGDGAYLQPLLDSAATVLGIDCSSVALERAGRRCPAAELIESEIDRELPLVDNSFDLVWCVDALEHIVDTQTALSEMRRVLRPGGELIVATPDHRITKRVRLAITGWDRYFDPFSPHLRFYTQRSLRDALESCGFTPQVTRHRDTLIARAIRS